MHRAIEKALWQGRVDDEAGAERWHQKIVPFTPEVIDSGEPGFVILGVCSDIGVKRNQGRTGAEKGPDAIRTALANQAWHLSGPCYDAGNLLASADDLEGLQEEQAAWVARLLHLGHFPLLLGGGHEIALGTHLGLRRHLEQREKHGVVGVINFDAHFDLRKATHSTSGTPFLQIAETCSNEILRFRYLCLGVSQVANTASLFARAESLGTAWLLDEELACWNMAEAEELVRDFVKACDFIQLSIDLDVLPAAVAPGVSAPSPRGVSLEVVEHILQVIKVQAGKVLSVAEIAECNPTYDVDGRTAKVAARLCHVIARPSRTVPPPSTEGEV